MTIELTLAPYSEQKILSAMRRYAEANGNRIPNKVSLRAIQDYTNLVNPDFRYRGVHPLALSIGTIYPGHYLSKQDLQFMGVDKIIVRWDNDTRTGTLKIN